MRIRPRGEQASNYVFGTFWLFADKGFKLLAELFVGFYLARHLGTHEFGLLNFAISFVILFQGISTLGISEVLVREFLNNDQQKSIILSTALLLRLLAASGLFVVLQICAIGFDNVARLVILIVSTSLFFRSFEVFVQYFHSIVRGQWIAYIQMFVTLVGSLLKIILIVLQKDIVWFAYVYSIEWLVLGIGLFTIYLKVNGGWVWVLDKNWVLGLLRSGWYLMLSAAAVNLYMRLDQVMIRQMVNDAANGQYAAAVRLSEVWYVLPTILCGILFPAVINARNRSQTAYAYRLKSLNSFLFWSAVAIAAIVSPFSDAITVFLYGQEYAAAGQILSWHIWTAPFVFWGVSSGYWLIAEKMERASLFRTFAGLGLNALLNYVLIPLLGPVGAAIGTLAGQIMATVVWMLALPSTRPIVMLQFRSIVFPFKVIHSMMVRSL